MVGYGSDKGSEASVWGAVHTTGSSSVCEGRKDYGEKETKLKKI